MYSENTGNRRGETLGFSLIADHTCNCIFDITGHYLAEKGISLLLADLDNTLVPYGVALPTDEVYAWRDELKQAGVQLFVLSNNRRVGRPDKFCQALEVPFIGHAGKPKIGGLLKAMEQMGVTPAQTALIGDQIFTDVLGGNRAGVMTILVKPIRLAGNPGRYVRYAAELPFRAFSARGGNKR